MDWAGFESNHLKCFSWAKVLVFTNFDELKYWVLKFTKHDNITIIPFGKRITSQYNKASLIYYIYTFQTFIKIH